MPEQRRQGVQVEIFGHADANLAAAVAAEPLLSLLVQGEDAPRVGLKHLALLGQPKPTHIAHDEA